MKPSIGGPLENHAARIAALEAELAALKRLIRASGLSSVAHDETLSGNGTLPDPLSAAGLSGSIDAAIHSLSGSVNSAIQAVTSGGLTFVTTDNTLGGDGTALDPLSAASLSSSIDSSIKSSTGGIYTSIQVGVTASIVDSYTSLQTGVTASIAGLSGTINARFLNVTGSLISSVSNVYSSLQTGISGTINTTVNGTSNTVPKFTSAHAIGNSSIMDDGTTVDVNSDTVKFGSSGDGSTYIAGSAINFGNGTNAVADGYLNYAGYNLGFTQFRNLIIADGKASPIVVVTGSTGAVTMTGDQRVVGSITGSGQSLLSTALLSNPWPSGSGVRTVVTLDDSSGAKRAGDGQRLRFTFGSFNYNAWIAAVTTRANPDFLNPRLEFAVQQAFTTGLTNVTATLIVDDAGIQVTGSARVQGAITGSAVLARRGSTSIAGLGYEVLTLENNSDTVINFKGPAGNEKSIYFSNPSNVADGGIVYDHPSVARGFQVRTGGNNVRVTIDSAGITSFRNDVVTTGTLIVNASNAGGTLSVRPANNNSDGIFMDQNGGYTASIVYEGTGGDLGGWGFTFKAPSNATTQVDVLKLRGDRRVYVSGNLFMSGAVDMGTSFRIVNLQDPSAAQDAATKNYVDSISGSAASGIAALSATVNARFVNVTGSMISSFSRTYSSLQAGVTASINGLSGTINARFLNLTGSLISGLSNTYSSLQAGISSSIADLSGTIDAQRVSDGVDPVRSMEVFDEYLFTSLSTNSANALYTTLAGSGAGWIFLPVTLATKDLEYSQVGQLGWLPHPQGIRIKYDAWAALNNVSSPTEQSRITLGFGDTKAGAQANGFFWENDQAVHGNTNWWLVAVNSSTRTQLDTGLTGNVDPHHFSLELNEACTAVTGAIDGKAAIILTGSGVPNSFNPIAPLAQIFKTVGSTSQHALWVDYQWGRGLTSGSSARR
ncbi:MAG TPA: hypothetical protein VFT74_18880 [Isosphaeraceae bacterium]|nr:hypothetical protein [Isosphaeraceae bacterium]